MKKNRGQVRKAEELTRDKKIEWMAVWAARHKAALNLEGECGFGRECVGILVDGKYPDYEWHNEKFERADNNGEVWTPEDAYHKHPCVAVLGRGEAAEAQLFDWLKWFEENDFSIETGLNKMDPGLDPMITLILGQHTYSRMVRNTQNGAVVSGASE